MEFLTRNHQIESLTDCYQDFPFKMNLISAGVTDVMRNVQEINKETLLIGFIGDYSSLTSLKSSTVERKKNVIDYDDFFFL